MLGTALVDPHAAFADLAGKPDVEWHDNPKNFLSRSTMCLAYYTTFVPQFLFLHLMIACSSFPDVFPPSVFLLNPDCIFRYSPVSVTDQKYR